MQTHPSRRAFTIVELLFAATATLTTTAALFTATTSSRQEARIAACTSNMKEHMLGMMNFASANDQATLNAPPSPGGDLQPKYGHAGQPAFRFATTDQPVNGFAFGDDGIRTMGHPTSPPTFLTHTDRWMNSDQSLSHMYWVVLSEYAVDGFGTTAMFDIFLSPSDEQGHSDWDAFIDWVENQRNGSMPDLPQPKDNAAPIPGLEDKAPRGISNGSYLYPSSMIVTPEVWLRNPRTSAPVNPALYEKWGRFDADNAELTTADNHLRVVRRNRLSDILYPPNKVAFFLDRAVHNPEADWWFQTGATSTIALNDGSARAITPSTDAAKADQRQNAGPALTLAYKGPEHPGPSPFANQAEGATPLPFIATWGGIRGRDLD